MRRFAAVLVAAAVLAVASPAAAHSFGGQGPTHTHATGSGACTPSGTGCYRWILANGAIIQGNLALMQQQEGYLLVFCSWRTPPGSTADDPFNEGWAYNKTRWGPYGHIGEQHPYCRSPQYTVPGFGSPFLAGWSVNA